MTTKAKSALPEHADPYPKKSNYAFPETRLVRLTRGKVAVVDEEDFDWIMRWKWRAVRKRSDWCAARTGPENKTIYMHRVLTFAEPNEEVDHKNGDGLDNRQTNLRRCTPQENQRGFRRRLAGKTSRFRGVYWHRRGKKWAAQIMLRPGVNRHIGLFDDEDEAGRAYAKMARLHFGAFADANIFSQAKEL